MSNQIRDRCRETRYDAVVVGSGPNGLAAAITMARAGRSVVVLEAEETIGGGCRTAELTLPGFLHDVCSAIHPLGVGSPFFRSVDLAAHGVEWIYPPAQFAHLFDDEPAALAFRSVTATGVGLGDDAANYQRLMGGPARDWRTIADYVLGPLRLPRHPAAVAAFGVRAVWPATWLAPALFRTERARALFAGVAAHSMLPLSYPTSAGAALMLGLLAHGPGWPISAGGSQRIADALDGCLRGLGGEIVTGVRVEHLDDLPEAPDRLLDVTPRQLLTIAGHALPSRYRRQLTRFRYGPGAFKIDYALDGPVPWKDETVTEAGTVHLGGTMAEIEASEADVARGRHPDQPFILAAQQSLFDPSRAPAGKHTFWAYCHVPNGSSVDMTERIERQIERFAPGFRDRVLARYVTTPADFERHDANYVGGDINGGSMILRQIYTRPTIRLNPYTTPIPGLYVCSSSTPPAGGVHGMCGYWAAQIALGKSIFV
jgi:phytoene dehydrogenase-like protein